MITGVKINVIDYIMITCNPKNVYYWLHSITWRRKNVNNYSWLRIPKSAAILYMYHGGQFYDTHDHLRLYWVGYSRNLGEGGEGLNSQKIVEIGLDCIWWCKPVYHMIAYWIVQQSPTYKPTSSSAMKKWHHKNKRGGLSWCEQWIC